MELISPYILHPKYSDSHGYEENLDPDGADALQVSVRKVF